MMYDLVSIIIPAHMEERYIGLTLEACLLQSYSPLEIIVAHNGGLDDRTLEIAASYIKVAKNPERDIKIMSQPRIGASAARNMGARGASGKYVAFLDADTLIPPTLIQRSVEAVSQGFAGVFAQVRFDQDTAMARILQEKLNSTGPRMNAYAFCSSELFRRTHSEHSVFREDLAVGEDTHFTEVIMRYGKTTRLDLPVITSARRLEEQCFADAAARLG